MTQQIIDLSGDWGFGYMPDMRDVTELSLPDDGIFETLMPVPAYWDDHKDRMGTCMFYGREAKFNPDYRPMEFPMGQIAPDASTPYLLGVGWYRKNIFVDSEPGGKLFILQIGPCMMNTAIWCNGKKISSHLGFSTGFEVELTDFVRDGENEIIIAVSNTARNRRSCAARGYKGFRGGIGGGIKLKIAGQTYIKDFHAWFEKGGLSWNVELGGKKVVDAELRWTVFDPCSRYVVSSGMASAAKHSFRSEIPNLELWSDNRPKMYQLKLVLENTSGILDCQVHALGNRQLEVAGYKILLNKRPVYLRGSTEHCYFPETCNPHWDKAEYKSNIRRLKEVGFNWLRFHTWCPPEPYLEAADEEGMLVQVEFPRDSTKSEWEDIIRLARRHPSVIIFCGGNEELLDEDRIEELRNLAELCQTLSPDILFNPHEGLRGVEYGEESYMGITVDEPFKHNPQRLAALAEFSDVYGAFGMCWLSYAAGDFDEPERLDRNLAIYGKPCLSHEVGILGNYLNIDLEKRYENTYIGTELFSEIRRCLKEAGLLHKSALYYRNSCLITAIIRKHTMENARRCSKLGGYDFLGGIDTHWHRCGYPCGVLNEFYELKPGQTAGEIKEYNGESVLLLDARCERNLNCGDEFIHKVMVSYWGPETLDGAILTWECQLDDGTVILHGEIESPALVSGEIIEIGTINFTVPGLKNAAQVSLNCRLSGENIRLKNSWNFWFFPVAGNFLKKIGQAEKLIISSALTMEQLQFLDVGGNVLLTDNFPMDTVAATFQPSQSGRVTGDLATVIYDHPALNNFPHRGFCDWQFYKLLKDSRSMLFEDDLIPFEPLIEIVSSFKHIRRKAALCEFKVGSGRLMMTSLNLQSEDPAARTLLAKLTDYLAGEPDFAVPQLDMAILEKTLSMSHQQYTEMETDCALDPNA